MAKSVSIATTDTESEGFRPQTNFIVVASQAASLTGQYVLQIRSINPTGTWVEMASAPMQLATTNKVIAASGSPGFEYRIFRKGGTAETADLTFHWDHVTTLRSVYN